jgi:hypothetical protein
MLFIPCSIQRDNKVARRRPRRHTLKYVEEPTTAANSSDSGELEFECDLV